MFKTNSIQRNFYRGPCLALQVSIRLAKKTPFDGLYFANKIVFNEIVNCVSIYFGAMKEVNLM